MVIFHLMNEIILSFFYFFYPEERILKSAWCPKTIRVATKIDIQLSTKEWIRWPFLNTSCTHKISLPHSRSILFKSGGSLRCQWQLWWKWCRRECNPGCWEYPTRQTSAFRSWHCVHQRVDPEMVCSLYKCSALPSRWRFGVPRGPGTDQSKWKWPDGRRATRVEHHIPLCRCK